MTDLSRRNFLRRAAIAAPSLAGLVACSDSSTFDPLSPGDGDLSRGMFAPERGRGGYGALKVNREYPQISIAAGFHAKLLSTSGELMSDGNVAPNAMDGMGAFAAGGNRVRLVRNHEIRNSRNDPNRVTMGTVNLYDQYAPSGNTTLERLRIEE